MHCALRHPAWITLLLLLMVADRTQAQQNPKLTRKVAENWKDFGLQKTPPPVDGAIDLSYLAEAKK